MKFDDAWYVKSCADRVTKLNKRLNYKLNPKNYRALVRMIRRAIVVFEFASRAEKVKVSLQKEGRK